MLNVKLPHLDSWSAGRRARAAFYRAANSRAMASTACSPCPSNLRRISGIEHHHIYNQFIIRAPRRDDLRPTSQAHGIGAEIYYPLPLHLQECFRYLGYREGEFPEAERAARETLALPIFPELTEDQQGYVVQTIAGFYA